MRKVTPADKFHAKVARLYKELSQIIAEYEAETAKPARRAGKMVFKDPVNGERYTIKPNR